MSEKLANTERHLDVAKSHSLKAEDKTDELKQLNRSIFRPVITFNKDAKRAAQERKIQERYDDERSEREKAMMDIRETQNRLGRATTYGRGGDDDEEGIGGRKLSAVQQAARQEQRKRYQFEATASDDEMEDEIDNNLDEISDMTKRLKMLGSAMGEELDKQNNRIETIEGKTVNLDNRVFRNTEKVSCFVELQYMVSNVPISPTAQAHQVAVSSVITLRCWFHKCSNNICPRRRQVSLDSSGCNIIASFNGHVHSVTDAAL